LICVREKPNKLDIAISLREVKVQNQKEIANALFGSTQVMRYHHLSFIQIEISIFSIERETSRNAKVSQILEENFEINYDWKWFPS